MTQNNATAPKITRASLVLLAEFMETDGFNGVQ
jgi:hypothetical protein